MNNTLIIPIFKYERLYLIGFFSYSKGYKKCIISIHTADVIRAIVAFLLARYIFTEAFYLGPLIVLFPILFAKGNTRLSLITIY